MLPSIKMSSFPIRCHYKTKSNEQCKRNGSHNDGLCRQHYKVVNGLVTTIIASSRIMTYSSSLGRPTTTEHEIARGPAGHNLWSRVFGHIMNKYQSLLELFKDSNCWLTLSFIDSQNTFAIVLNMNEPGNYMSELVRFRLSPAMVSVDKYRKQDPLTSVELFYVKLLRPSSWSFLVKRNTVWVVF